MKKLVSIIIVVYNTELYLEKCIDSVCKQTYLNLEIILLDNGSTDGSGKIIRKFKNIDQRIRYYDIGKNSVAFARNKGIELAQGEYITFVDSDDFVEYRFIESLVYYKEKFNAQMSICNLVRYIDQDNIIDKVPIYEPMVVDGKQLCNWMNRFLNLCTVTTVVWNKLFEAREIKKFRFPEEPWGEDMFFTYQFLFPLKKVIVFPDKLYYWRENPVSLSRLVHNTPKQLCEVKAYDERSQFFKEANEEELYALTLRRQLYVMAQQVYKQKNFNQSAIEVQVELKNKINQIYREAIKSNLWSAHTLLLMAIAFYFPYIFGYLTSKFKFDLEK